MTLFVLDASIALAWLLNEEAGPQADRAWLRLKDGDALVPQLWHFEVRNGLLFAMRRGRIAREASAQLLGALERFAIRTDAEPDPEAAFDLADRHRLTIYDAAYLEAALRNSAPLATLDKALARAAAECGLSLVCDPIGP